MDPKEWFPKWATRSELAAAALGYAIGFAVDVFYFPEGVPPGTTASVFAVATVGLKNSMQAIAEGLAKKRQERLERAALEEKASILLQVLVDENLEAESARLTRDLRLWRKGVLGAEDLRQILEQAVREYRAQHSEEREHHSTAIAIGRFQTLEGDQEPD